MIEMIDVHKGFNIGQTNEFIAVNGVSLNIEDKKITVLKGPSGSGKTTLLSLMGCMARPTSGRIRLTHQNLASNGFPVNTGEDSIEITSLPERFLTDIRRQVFGFIFQQFNLIKGITLLENVMLPAYPIGMDYAILKKRAQTLLDMFGLENRGSARIEWLSGGEAQRAAIARALMNDPPVVIADEPTAHLDSSLSLDFMKMIDDLKKAGKTIIIASHDPLVFQFQSVDRVIAIRDGLVTGEEK